jgi:vancomycin permeability regulator SanA
VALKIAEDKPTIPILISGDSEKADYCETITMNSFLIENGIEESRIINDGYGLSTYESIWRAKNVYGFDKILIVTQKYHLYRSVFIAKQLDMESYGVDGALQGYAKQPLYSVREYFARIKDIIYSELCPEPSYLTKWEMPNE